MVTELVVDKEPDRLSVSTDTDERESHGAAIAFGVVLVVGLIFYVVAGRHIWFYRDEWDYLAGRGMNVHDLLAQHGGHLSVVPVVIYRLMYSTIGLRSYVPYQLLTILLHLAEATLLWVIMRRARVRPWVATVVAAAFVFFGSASQDILWADQIGFSGALAFGLTQIVLVDHDGPVDRRDWFALGAGLLSILSAGTAIATLFAVGLAMLVRRGWRIALMQTVPFAVLYGAWWLHYTGTSQASVHDPHVLWGWVRTGVVDAFDALGQVSVIGWAIAVMLVTGAVLAWRQVPASARRKRFAVPAAMLLGSVAFLLLTGVNRAWIGIQFAGSSRYLHITVALMIPALGVAADALIRRWRGFAVVVPLLFLIGIPGNLRATGTNLPNDRFFSNYAEMVKSLPRTELAHQVPRGLVPEPVNAPWMTVGFLLDGAHSGLIPAPSTPPTPKQVTEYRLRLSLEQVSGGTPNACVPAPRTLTSVDVSPGQSWVVVGLTFVALAGDQPGTTSNQLPFGASFLAGSGPHTMKDVGGPMTLLIKAAQPGAKLCGLPLPS
jgi:hypothetical protein